MLKLGCLSNLFVEIFDLWLDTLRFIPLSLRSHFALAAENLFLRKQLALTWSARSNLAERRSLPG